MNIQEFFYSLNDQQREEIYNLSSDWKHEKSKNEAKKIQLNDDEKLMIINGDKIEAIKYIKNRCNCSLLTAKFAVDYYRENIFPVISQGKIEFIQAN